MELKTTKIMIENAEAFIINHSHYNYWDESTPEFKILNEMKAIKVKLNKILKMQHDILNAVY